MLSPCNNFLFSALKQSKKPIVLYGMGDGADKILERLNVAEIPVSGIFVSDGFVRDKIFHGFRIQSYSDICRQFDDFVVLVAFGTSLPDVIANIERIAKERELYAPYIPVTGDGSFDEKYLKTNFDRLNSIYDRLADEKSRRTFESIVNYRISGDITYLRRCETNTDELYSLISLRDYEVYADFGAYRGDTIADFVHYAGAYSRIYAAEPDEKTFRKLKDNTAGLENIALFNAAAYSHSDGVLFAVKGGRQSKIQSDGQRIPSIAADDIRGEAPTYIKMDIEGAEIPAIYGAEKTIKDHKPKMLISCYHRIDDLFAIPELVLSFRNDYKLYMCHRPYIPDWDTEFVFV